MLRGKCITPINQNMSNSVISSSIVAERVCKRQALDFLKFYAQYNSQITYSRAFNYYFEWTTLEITEMALADGQYRI
jgi:hypothetical protein